jgi:hypothetical protein
MRATDTLLSEGCVKIIRTVTAARSRGENVFCAKRRRAALHENIATVFNSAFARKQGSASMRWN